MLGLIHGQTVYQLRTQDRNPILGLVFAMLQSLMILMGFMALFLILGTRTSPLRGDFILFLMSGIFVFMTHTQTATKVAGSYSLTGLAQHAPLNAPILVISSALTALYTQTLSAFVVLGLYHTFWRPIEIENISGCIFVYLLSWFNGLCVGVLFLAIRPWFPRGGPVITRLYIRINMICSGKMFLANTIPSLILPFFIWSPLFHSVDQMRGFVFINYSPHRTELLYPLWFSVAVLIIGLLINFTTRKYESVSWSAGR